MLNESFVGRYFGVFSLTLTHCIHLQPYKESSNISREENHLYKNEESLSCSPQDFLSNVGHFPLTEKNNQHFW
jgi:hypothetical protein